MTKYDSIDSALYAEKAAEPVKPPLLQEVSVLHRLYEEVDALIDKLVSRLHPVTRTESEPTDVVEAAMVPKHEYDAVSPLVGDIQVAQGQARDLARRIRTIIDKLDL